MRHYKRRKEDECFGLPHGGAIFGLIIGVIIILWGISYIAEIDFGNYFWPVIIIIFGILIVAGAIYKFGRRS
jgi:amino acid transporter